MTLCRLAIVLTAVLVPLLVVGGARAGVTQVGTKFTYQGRLQQAGEGLNNSADFQFRLWDSAVGGSPASVIQQPTNVTVTDGLFTTQIDFLNNAWDGSARWLEIAVRVPHDPSNLLPFTTLTPRQEVTVAPYALQTRGLFVSGTGNLGLGTTAPLSRLSVGGDLTFLEDGDTIRFPATSGVTEPMIEMFDSGTANADRMVIAHSPTFNDWGLRYSDAADDFQFTNSGVPKITLDLGQGDLSFSDDQASISFPNADATNAPMIYMYNTAGNSGRMVLAHSPAFADWGLSYSDSSDRFQFEGGGLSTLTVGLSSEVLDPGFVSVFGDFSVANGKSTLVGQLEVETSQEPAVIIDGVGGGTLTLVSFQVNDVEMGTIEVLNNLVMYNGFTGSHMASTDESLEMGELVSLTGVNGRLHGNPECEIVYGVSRCAVVNDSKCLGAYLAKKDSGVDATDNPHMVMAVGNGDMWVAESSTGNIEPGDYLISSDVAGCAMKDDPDRFSTGHVVARAGEGVDWAAVESPADGSPKSQKISVFFESFARDSRGAELGNVVETQNRKIELLESQLAVMAERLARLEASHGGDPAKSPQPNVKPEGGVQ